MKTISISYLIALDSLGKGKSRFIHLWFAVALLRRILEAVSFEGAKNVYTMIPLVDLVCENMVFSRNTLKTAAQLWSSLVAAASPKRLKCFCNRSDPGDGVHHCLPPPLSCCLESEAFKWLVLNGVLKFFSVSDASVGRAQLWFTGQLCVPSSQTLAAWALCLCKSHLWLQWLLSGHELYALFSNCWWVRYGVGSCSPCLWFTFQANLFGKALASCVET